jgi:type I restriction enzyme S subunit
VEWLGAIPAHWRKAQLRHVVDRIEQGVSPQAYAELADEGWGVLKSGCVNGGVFADLQHKKLPDDFEIDPVMVVEKGDLLVCRASGTADLVGSTAVVRQLRYRLILSDKTFRLIPGSLTSINYLEWAMNSRMYREQVRRAISGAEGLANNLPMSELKSFIFALPPRGEQNQIFSFLDRETAKIDALIAKQEQLIATLREDRTATITHAVTKGLDPDVDMKDSDIPWVGQVPCRWTLSKVKHGFSVVLGKMYQGEAADSDDMELPHLKAGSITEGGLDLSDPMMCWFNQREVANLNLRAGDVLVAEGGAIGRCVVLHEDLPGWGFQKSLNRVRAREDDSPRFLAYLIEAATECGHVSVLCGKATIPHFTAEKLAALEWPRPEPPEQRQIAKFLDNRCADISSLITKADAVIATLREYRSALITDAVTGKIDVRKVA